MTYHYETPKAQAFIDSDGKHMVSLSGAVRSVIHGGYLYDDQGRVQGFVDGDAVYTMQGHYVGFVS
jgi:hypothetical protein